MNRNQLIILLVLVVALGAAGIMLHNRQKSSWQGANPSAGKKLLGDFPINDVAHIEIKQGTDSLNLAKKDESWRVRERNDYPANFSQISDLLIKLGDLKIVQSEPVGQSQLARLNLVPGPATNSALVVDFKDKNDKAIRSLLLGKKHMKKSNRPNPMMGDMDDEESGGLPDGRFVKVGSDSKDVILISDALANVDSKPDQWLNKDFFKVEKIRSVAVNFPIATNSWKLSRETETGEWKLADAKPTEQLDNSKASGVGNSLASPGFNDVSMAKPEELGLDKPTTVTLDTFDNFTYTIKVGQKTNDNLPLVVSVAAELPKERAPGKDEKPEDKDKLDKEFKEKQKKLEEKLTQEKPFEKWTYLVSNWTLDQLLKERSQLLLEKKEEPKKDDKPAAAIETQPANTKNDSPLAPLPGAETKQDSPSSTTASSTADPKPKN
jgi:Domain of unknown function (DUF4340)